MTLVRFRKSIFTLALLLFPAMPAHSQNMVSELDEKFHLEKSISERLEQTLKTRLEKSYFDITVEAKLQRKSLPTFKKRFDSANTAEEVQRWYASELNQASRQNNRPFELESLVVTLGLSDQVDPKYQADLKEWLKNWVHSSFGAQGQSQVLIRPSNIINKNNHNQTDENSSKWSGISRYQNLLGMMFLGCAFVLVWHLQGRKRVRTDERSLESLPAQTDPNEAIQKELIRTLKTKIAWISPGIQRQIETLVASWTDKENPSYLKMAAYLEALAEGSASMPEASKVQAPFLPAHAHLSLPKALANLQELDTFMQVNLYQEIYSELLVGQLIEREPRHVDFEFIQDWNDKDLLEAFDFLSEPCKVALLVHLPQTMRRRFAQISEPGMLRQILDKSLLYPNVTDAQLLNELESWKQRKIGSVSNAEFALKIAKFREVWSVFSRQDEAMWMHQVVLNHPEMRQVLAREGTHLAFLSYWSSDSIRKFCLSTKSRELAAAAKLLPFLAPAILNACGEGTRNEIQQEMAQLSEPKLSQSFERFIANFDQFVEVEKPQHHSLLQISSTKSAA
ncbi:hypothetical protein [Bdellovibrio svalbardensis]|uniref:Uncharacterized protein n=1 Tax=Bdellovibrio svalbardensis TaxID=2972972 RepID=A0ABT6DPD3_9BACT|nr:hypothetical protein [Bdellovibrio svalbardensis]MDG0817696.1 hypothetical protein [Bdellovibrio svalbardensis]